MSCDDVCYNCINFEAHAILFLLSLNLDTFEFQLALTTFNIFSMYPLTGVNCFCCENRPVYGRLYSPPQFLEGLHESHGFFFLQFCEVEKVVIDVNKTLNLVEIALEIFLNLQFFPKKLLPQCKNSPKQETLFMMLS